MSFGSLPLFEIQSDDIDSILSALLENRVLTDLNMSLPDGNQSDITACLLKQFLGCAHCPLESLTVSSVAMSSWKGLCDALKGNTTVRTLEIGTAASVFVPEDPESLDRRACQQFADALANSPIECLTLRRFEIEPSGWPWFVKAFEGTQTLELHQIVSESNLFDRLADLSENLRELSTIQCSAKTNNGDAALPTIPIHPSSLRLEKLSITQCKSSEFVPYMCRLGRLERLTYLDIQENPMNDYNASILTEWLPQQSWLEQVILDGCELTDQSLSSVLSVLGRHQLLHQLNARRNRLRGDSSNVCVLPPNLKVLDLAESEGLGDSSWLPILVERNPHVLEWNLDSINMTEKGFTDLCAAIYRQGEISKIQVLDIRQTSMGANGLKELTRVLESKLTSLTKLNLASCKLDDDAIAILFSDKYHGSSLTELSISYNPFGNPGCRVIAEAVTKMPALRSLDIPFGRFDQEGLQYFVAALKENPRLEDLNYWTLASFRGELAKVEDELGFWLSLNQAGRRVTNEPVNTNLYPIVLERAARLGGRQALYYILRESVHLFEST